MAVVRLSLTSLSFGVAIAPLIKQARTAIGWTQRELAEKANVSQALVWRLESAQPGALDLGRVEQVLNALGIRATLELDDRHLADRERQRDGLHVRITGFLVRHLRRHGWLTATELMIPGDHGPRGWIDLVAFRAADQTLIVEETKTELPDVGALQRSLAFYERMARRAVEALGWWPRRVVVLCVVLDSDAVADRIIGARSLLLDSFPANVDATLRWIEDPALPVPAGWCLAGVDPASRRRDWLHGTDLRRRRRRPAYRNYADAMVRLGQR
jgi:transcriptional regulator with XRE-family HTH domain